MYDELKFSRAVANLAATIEKPIVGKPVNVMALATDAPTPAEVTSVVRPLGGVSVGVNAGFELELPNVISAQPPAAAGL